MSQKLRRKADDQDGQGQPKKTKGGPDLTEFAEIYSHPPWFKEDHDDPLSYTNPLRSGMTPLDEGPFSTEEERNQYQVVEEYQKRIFKRTSKPPLSRIRNPEPRLTASNIRIYHRRA
jgi:hypothetical protein